MFNFKLSKTIWDVQWSFISLATASLSHLLLRIVLGRELGPSGLGVYTLVFTMYMFGMQFAGFGIGSALTKYVAEFRDDNQKVREYISSGMTGSLISGFIITIMLYLVSDFIAISIFHISEMSELLKIIAFCLPFIAIQKMVLGTLNGLRRMKSYAIINIIQNVFVLVLSVYFVLILNTDVKGAVLGLTIPTIITSLFSIIFIKNFVSTLSFSFTKSFQDVTWFGFYFVLANSIGMINTQVDSMMIGHFLDAKNVGYYSVATIVINGIILIPNSVHAAVAPSIAYFYGKSEYEKTTKFIQRIVLYVTVVIIIISISIALFGKALIMLLFKNEFILAYSPLLILLIGYTIYSPIHSVDCALLSIGKVNILYKISLFCTIFNIIFNVLLISKYGILGAALSTSMSIIILSIFKLYFINKHLFNIKCT
ncbi:flippase [Methanosarcina mazei]|uniref:flippase n=1 Tax=Methanosarcina mazei TaxID=2209 RepID=UPI003C741C56